MEDQNTQPEFDYHERIEQKIDALTVNVAAVQRDVHKIKQFFLWTFIVSIVTFVLPLLAAIILIPVFLSRYLNAFDGLL